MQEEYNDHTIENRNFLSNWIDTVKRYKIQLSVAGAVLLVGVSALAHYKNEKIKAELVKSIEDYRQGLVLIGADMNYASVECTGILSTDCDIQKISLSLMGQEQMSIKSLHLGNVEEYRAFKDFSKGENVDASIDIQVEEITLPRPLIAQVVAQNVSNVFQKNTLEKLTTLNLALRGEFEGDSSSIKRLVIDRLLVENAIMPIEFSMEAAEVSSASPDTMILEKFSLSVENRSISDVTYESIKELFGTLDEEQKALLLKEFSMKPSDMENQSKASEAINSAIAKQLDNDSNLAKGIIEKELIQAMAKILRGEAKAITLRGENHQDLTVGQVQTLLIEASAMQEEKAVNFMKDKFTLEVETD